MAFKSPTSPRPSPLLAFNLGHPFQKQQSSHKGIRLGHLQESCVCVCVCV